MTTQKTKELNIDKNIDTNIETINDTNDNIERNETNPTHPKKHYKNPPPTTQRHPLKRKFFRVYLKVLGGLKGGVALCRSMSICICRCVSLFHLLFFSLYDVVLCCVDVCVVFHVSMFAN